MKLVLALSTSGALLGVPAAQAIQIRELDRLAEDDKIEFVNQLVQSVEDASSGDAALLAKLKRFFFPKQPGEKISGMGRFELNLSLARIADLEAADENPKARRLEVEDVMYTNLERNGIALSRNFRPNAPQFHAANPLQHARRDGGLSQRGQRHGLLRGAELGRRPGTHHLGRWRRLWARPSRGGSRTATPATTKRRMRPASTP